MDPIPFPTKDQRLKAALQLKTNVVLWDTLAQLHLDASIAWRAAQDTEAREQLWHRERALTLLEQRINSAIQEALKHEQ